MGTLFDSLCAQLHVEPDRRGEVWIDCPSCGRGKKHFSFNERTAHCFGCDYSATLTQVAELLRIQPDERAGPVRRAQEAPRPRQWQLRPEWYLDQFCGALDRVTRWQGYKPLTIDSIARWRLGVGRLLASRCEKRRLIVPVFASGTVVAFHGRAYLADDTDAKWLTAGGSSKQVLFGADLLRPGATVVICENFVDAILAMQVEPSLVVVAGGGASWQQTWTVQIASSRPKQVLVWLDHDLAGNGSRYHYRELLDEWQRRNPNARHAPEPRGPQIANDLIAAGARAYLYEWPRGTPAKADIGWALTQDRKAA